MRRGEINRFSFWPGGRRLYGWTSGSPAARDTLKPKSAAAALPRPRKADARPPAAARGAPPIRCGSLAGEDRVERRPPRPTACILDGGAGDTRGNASTGLWGSESPGSSAAK